MYGLPRREQERHAALDSGEQRDGGLVNNAGIYPGATTALTGEETFDRVYAVNIKAPFFLTAAIAQAAAYLASDEASFVHGAVLDVDGGRTAVAVIAA